MTEKSEYSYGSKENIISISMHIIDYICIICFITVSIFSILFIYARNIEKNINKNLKIEEDYKIAVEQYEKIVKLNPIKKNHKIKLIKNLDNYIKLNED